MAKKKKLTVAEKAAKLKAAAKRITHGKIHKAVALIGPAAYRGLKWQATGNAREISVGIPKDQAGINPDDGSFDINRLARGYGGAVYNKIERWIFRGVGVVRPRLKPKNFSDFVRLGVYEGAAVMNASGGSTPADKFRRYYHSHNGVDLEGDGFGALDYSKPIIEKVLPYVLVNKIMQWVK